MCILELSGQGPSHAKMGFGMQRRSFKMTPQIQFYQKTARELRADNTTSFKLSLGVGTFGAAVGANELTRLHLREGFLVGTIMEFYAEEGKQLEEACSTLVLPALSIGNVGQLAADLLISSLRAERIGYLDDPNLLPCVGNNAYSPSPPGDLSLPLEAYASFSHGLTLIQQRSPVVKGMMIEFAKNLANFAAVNQKNHVVILSSLDFRRWQNIDMSSGLQTYYLSSSNTDGTDDDCEKIGWKRLPEYNPTHLRWEYLSSIGGNNSAQDHDFPLEDVGEEDYYPSLPFAALFSCFKAKGIKVTCLLCYCSEGDNIPDAFHLAEAASKILRRSPESVEGNGRWIVPFSWKSVYGPPPDAALF